MPSPEPADLQFLRLWLGGTGDGDRFLDGAEKYTWEIPQGSLRSEEKALEKDLLTLNGITKEQDFVTKRLSQTLLDFLTWLRLRMPSQKPVSAPAPHQSTPFRKIIDPNSGVMHYSERRLLKFNNILISVVGAILPIVAIVGLYFIKSEGGRIGAMAGFTLVFAIVIATFTEARRLEVAAATAA
jgi:hypothetical protein